MKRTLLVSMLLLFVAGEVRGQPEPKLNIEMGAGLAVPSSPDGFADRWNAGFSARVGLSAKMTPILTVMGSLDYNQFGFDDEAAMAGLPGSSIDGGRLSIVYLSGGMKVRPMGASPRRAQLSLLAGAGYYRVKVNEVNVTGGALSDPVQSGKKRALGVHFGASLDVSPFFVEALYVLGFTEGENTSHVPIRVGVSLRSAHGAASESRRATEGVAD